MPTGAGSSPPTGERSYQAQRTPANEMLTLKIILSSLSLLLSHHSQHTQKSFQHHSRWRGVGAHGKYAQKTRPPPQQHKVGSWTGSGRLLDTCEFETPLNQTAFISKSIHPTQRSLSGEISLGTSVSRAPRRSGPNRPGGELGPGNVAQ